MPSLPELWDRSQVFLESGGFALWAILILSLLMWVLILERYWYFRFIYPKQKKQIHQLWTVRCEHGSRTALRIRDGMLAELAGETQRFLNIIDALTQIMPMLGLLGTVAGMIQTFDVMAIFGGGNTRGMAGGISQALLTTMAGLVMALSGLYFNANLKHRTRQALAEAEGIFT